MSDFPASVLHTAEEPSAVPGALQHAQDNTDPWAKVLHNEDLPAGPANTWEVSRDYMKADTYRSLMDLSKIGSPDPKAQEEEAAKVQVSFYLADQMNLEPRTVYQSFDSLGHSLIAEKYFKTVDLPTTYKGRVVNEITRAAKTYQALNLMSGAMFSGYDPAKYKAWQEIMDSMPPAEEGEPGLFGFLKSIPLATIQMAPYIADMGLGELVGGGIGAAVGALAGPEAVGPGFALGRKIGGVIEGSRVGAAQIFQDVMTMPDPETGKPMYQVVKDPEQLANIARMSAAVFGGLTGGMQALGFEYLLGKGAAREVINRLGLGAVERAGVAGKIRSTFGTFLAKYGKNVGAQTFLMAAQSITNQIAMDTANDAYNGRLGENLPKANWQDYSRVAVQSADAAFRGSLLFAIPGSMGEARSAVHRALAERGTTEAMARVEKLDKIADTTRPAEMRAEEATARLAELSATQEKLRADNPNLATFLDPAADLSKVKPDTKLWEAIGAYRENTAETKYLNDLKRQTDLESQEGMFSESDWIAKQPVATEPPAPPEILDVNSPLVDTIQQGLPKLTRERAQGAYLYAGLLGSHVGETADQYLNTRFIPGIFDKTMAGALEAQGKLGGISWDDAGKAIFHATTQSNFSTWVHELTHLFTFDLSAEERARVDPLLGAKPGAQWTRDQHEKFANWSIAYMLNGRSPHPSMEPMFKRFGGWVDEVYHSVKDQWKVSDDVATTYEGLLAKRRGGAAQKADAGMLFETDPNKLSAYHNLDFQDLERVDKLGGLPMPSIAVTRPDIPFTQYGRVTLIGDRAMIDPAADSRNSVYNRDVYSPRVPRPEYHLDRKALGAFQKKMKPYFDQAGDYGDELYSPKDRDYFERGLQNSAGMKVAYLAEKGIPLQVKKGDRPIVYATRDAARDAIRKNGLDDDFEAWIVRQVDPLYIDPMIRVGGVRVPYNAENIVRAMTGHGVRAQEHGATFGLGAAAAAGSVKFRSIEAMRAQAPRLLTDEAQKAYLKENVETLANEMQKRVPKHYAYEGTSDFDRTWRGLDAMHRAIGQYLKGGVKKESTSRMTSALYRNGFRDFENDIGLVQGMVDLAHAMADTPSDYFEAKPARVVQLSDFRGAVIPDNTPDSVRTIFERAGVPTVEYTDGDTIARLAAVERFQHDNPDVLFQPSPHGDAVRKAVDNGLPVPRKVLQEYTGEAWARDELKRRAALIEEARKAPDFDTFANWMERSYPYQPAQMSYYQMLWDSAQYHEDPSLTAARFSAAMDDDTVKDILSEIEFVEGDQGTDRVVALTPEMRTLGKALLQGKTDEAALAKVREQIALDPEKWRNIFTAQPERAVDPYLPGRDQPSDLATASVGAAEGMTGDEFAPVSSRAANLRFIKQMEEGGLAMFASDLYATQLSEFHKAGVSRAQRFSLPRWIAVFGKQAHEGFPSQMAERMALSEIKKAASVYREMYAGLYKDEDMIRQLQHEEKTGEQAEDERLRGANSLLRAEVKRLRTAIKGVEGWDAKTTDKLGDLINQIAEKDQDLTSVRAEVQVAQLRVEELAKQVEEHRSDVVEKKYRQQIHILESAVEKQRNLNSEMTRIQWRRAQMEKLIRTIERPADQWIADYERGQIEDIQSRVTTFAGDEDPAMLNRLREWRRQNPNAPMPSQIVKDIESRDARLMTFAELDEVARSVRMLRQQGRKARLVELLKERNLVQGERNGIVREVLKDVALKDVKGLGTVGAKGAFKTPLIKKGVWGTWRMNRISDMLGPTSKRWLVDEVNTATDNMLRSVRGVDRESLALLREMGITAHTLGKRENIDGLVLTRSQMLGVYIYDSWEEGHISLVVDNKITDQTIVDIKMKLSPNEKQYGDWLVDTASRTQDFDRLQAAQLEFNNQRMERVDRYFPVQRRGPTGQAFLSEIAQTLLESRGFAGKPSPRRGFLKSRVMHAKDQDGNYIPMPQLNLDAPAIFADHINKREFFIANAQLIKRLTRIFDNKEITGALLEHYGDAMPSLVQKYIGNYVNPNIYRAIEDWGNMAQTLRANVGLSLIGSNVLTIARQLPDIPMIMLQAGPVDSIVAAAHFMRHPRQAIEFMREKSPQMDIRSFDRVIEELKVLDKNAYQRFVSRVGKAGFVALRAMDTVTNVVGWTAIYNKTLRHGGNEIAAVKAAQDFILQKRPAARAKDLAQFFREPGLMSWLTMFQNQPNQQWNVLTYDIPKQFIKGVHGDWGALWDATLNATALMVGAVGMGMIARKSLGDAGDIGKDLLNAIFGNVPFIGNDIESAIRGRSRMGGFEPLSGAYETAKAVVDVVGGAEEEKVVRDVINALIAISATAGLPSVQVRRIIRTMQSGDLWDLAGGPPKGIK